MKPFTFTRAKDVASAVAAGSLPDAEFVAGGTTLVDLMRLEVMTPATVVDVGALPLDKIEAHGDGIRIGAMVKNSDVARHAAIVERFPVLAEALLAGASAQVRNLATVGGNLLQRTRCPYFRDLASPCNKRSPGAGCSAIGGYTRSHAVVGGSEHCIATHPSDMCVALLALDAIVHTSGKRAIPIADFHTLPGDQPHVESALGRGELVTHVELPATGFAQRSYYIKVRDRAAFAFALASAAVALDVDRGQIRDARVALGGVGTRPWRAREVERALVGARATPDTFKRAAAAALPDAKPTEHNAFKVELARRAIARALLRAGGVG